MKSRYSNYFCIDGKRRAGKSTQLIYYAIANNLTIVSINPKHIRLLADHLGVQDQLKPAITYSAFMAPHYSTGSRNKYVIDDIDIFLGAIQSNEVVGFTHSAERKDVAEMAKAKISLAKKINRILRKLGGFIYGKKK